MTARFQINGCEVNAPVDAALFKLAEEAGVRVPTSCRGQGKCRECLVEVVEGMSLLSPLAEEERHLQPPFRLSCRCRIQSESGLVRCHTMRRGRIRIEDSGTSATTSDGPLDPAVTRDGDRVLLDGEEIARSTQPLHGLAIDLGTTTVVLRLVDLETGETRASHAFENPQRFAGSDIMARIAYDTENPGRLLQRTLAGYLSHAIEDLPVETETIHEVVVAGNPTMRDLFFRLDVKSIGRKPYQSVTERECLEGIRSDTSLSVSARSLGLPLHAKARVYGLPLIGSHVGGDAAACLAAIGIENEQRVVALMDIGTNTELVIGNRDRLLAASCPAGPAFEGGMITCGMPGLEGAIERVRIDEDGRLHLEVIGGSAPEGICGSGLIDLLAELLRTGRMNELGRFEDGSDAITLDEDAGIVFREADINELAQAKGAHVAGMHIVTQAYGLRLDDIEVFHVAGGFGRHLNLDAARRIGLIPDLPGDRVCQIGNAAIEGATQLLLSTSRRETLERLVQSIRHVELETDPGFFDHFVDGCQFWPMHDPKAASS